MSAATVSRRHAFDWRDLDWPRRYIQRVSTGGTPFSSWVPAGMPRIPSEYLDLAIYLYNSGADAERGHDVGGTGFLVGVQSKTRDDRWFIYAVSNRHLVRQGSSVVRLNKQDGGVDIFEFGPDEWEVHPNGDDVAAISIGLNSSKHRFKWIGEGMLLSPDEVGTDEAAFTIGDDIFQIGRFALHDGAKVNRPSARFGNLSIPLMPISGEYTENQESFGVEVHSISGYSGSPVFISRNIVGIGNAKPGKMHDNPIRLLGICWSHIPLSEEVFERIVKAKLTGLRPGEELKQFVNLNSGMDMVIPSWKLRELLDIEKFCEQRRLGDEHLLRYPPESAAVEDGVSLPPIDYTGYA